MMMVHKFTIECGGQRVAWAKVAASARALGVELPAHLPSGFAPISRLAGRFVLPGLVRSKPGITHVATQDLSPDSVIITGSTRPRAEPAQWVTVVDSEAQASTSGEAFKVAGVISMLLVTLMAGCLIVARRRSLLSFEFAGWTAAAGTLASSAGNLAMRLASRTRSAFRHSYESWRAAADDNGDDPGPANMLAIVHSRLAETELLVAGLPADLLLRDVLQSELDGLRERGADVARRGRRLGAERANAMLRSLTRELDRITRIVHGAAQRVEDDELTAAEAPASIFEAYRILGLNPEAPYVAVKKGRRCFANVLAPGSCARRDGSPLSRTPDQADQRSLGSVKKQAHRDGIAERLNENGIAWGQCRSSISKILSGSSPERL